MDRSQTLGKVQLPSQQRQEAFVERRGRLQDERAKLQKRMEASTKNSVTDAHILLHVLRICDRLCGFVGHFLPLSGNSKFLISPVGLESWDPFIHRLVLNVASPSNSKSTVPIQSKGEAL